MKKIIIPIIGLLMISSVWAATSAKTLIRAEASSIVIEYANGSGGTASKTAVSDNIKDSVATVNAIHGLVPGAISCADIPGFVATTKLYSGLAANKNYGFKFDYRNHSNEGVTIDITASLAQAAARWSVAKSNPVYVAEDQVGSMRVTVNSGTAWALEYVTLNTTAFIAAAPSPLNVIKYNPFTSANYTDVNGIAYYGGVNNVTASYTLRAEGYNITIESRSVVVEAPSSYVANGGNATDPVPGAKITYTIVVRNNNSSVARDVDISDVIPNNCHLYFNTTPTVTNADNAWVAATGFTPKSNTVGAGQSVTFQDVSVKANATATLVYSVTID